MCFASSRLRRSGQGLEKDQKMKTPSILPKRFVQRGSNRGIAVVYIALLLVVLLAFVGLAIDIGYMYVAKTQLQNAADAAALAGANLLDGTNATIQTAARQEAYKFAALNKAAGQNISIDLNTGNDDKGDVVVGYWNGTDVVTPGAGQLINAVKVTCRRTGETGTGIAVTTKVPLTFSRVINWSEMGVSAKAIAYLPPLATAPIPLCVDALNLCFDNCSTSKTFYFKKQDTTNPILVTGFTEFQPYASGQPPQNTNYGPDSLVAKYIRGEIWPPNVCKKSSYTNNAAGGQIMDVVMETFAKAINVEFDKNAKSIVSSDPSNKYWQVVVPVGCVRNDAGICETNPCKPLVDVQGQQWPVTFSTYAKIRIIAVYSNPTPSFTVNYIKDIGCNPTPGGLGLRALLVK